MKVLGNGRFVRLVQKDAYEFVERVGCTGIVSVIAITPFDELLFVEQYRPAVACRTIELMAGLAGDEREESLEAAARRELLEETGYAAGTMEFLMDGASAGGITSARVSYFLARDVVRTGPGGGVADEDITVHAVPVREAMAWLQQMSCGLTLVDPKVFFGVAVALYGWEATRETPP